VTVIRPVTAEELPGYLAQASGAFWSAPAPPGMLEAQAAAVAAYRNLGAFDGGELVGTAGTEPMALTVPGGSVAAVAIGRVSVLPTHRRRGIMTAMMRQLIDDARERGDPAAILFASEGAIYGRYGFGVATYEARTRIARHRGAFRKPVDVAGLRLVPWADAVGPMREISERVCASVPGAIRRGDPWWRYRVTGPPPHGIPWEAVLRPEGDGFVAYERRLEFTLPALEGGSLHVNWLFAETPEAYAALWRFCLDVDLMSEVLAEWRPVDEPLRHLLADPRALETVVWDGLWLRLVDVEAGLAARSYPPGPPVRVRVHDDFCPWNTGTHEVGEGGCGRTTDEPDLVLPADALGACFLGGNRFTTLARAGRVEERTTGAARRADVLFAADREPWCPFHF
jgi:predicted acetyltransferase